MTLNIIWRDPLSRVHFFSDSRVNLGCASSDFGIKVTRVPYNIYSPSRPGEKPSLLQCGDIAITFAGQSVLPLMMKEALAEILFSVQAIPGWSRYDMEALSKFIFHAFEVIARDADFRTNGAIDVGVIFGGWCEATRKHRVYKMEVTKDTVPTLTEVLLNPGYMEVMGSGKAEAERLLMTQQLNPHTIFTALKSVIENDAIPSVGGNIQYGDLDGNRFRPHGVVEIKDGRVHYWRGPLDLNSEELQRVTSLVPSIIYVDLPNLLKITVTNLPAKPPVN